VDSYDEEEKKRLRADMIDELGRLSSADWIVTQIVPLFTVAGCGLSLSTVVWFKLPKLKVAGSRPVARSC